jgi:hypothetical protein
MIPLTEWVEISKEMDFLDSKIIGKRIKMKSQSRNHHCMSHAGQWCPIANFELVTRWQCIFEMVSRFCRKP